MSSSLLLPLYQSIEIQYHFEIFKAPILLWSIIFSLCLSSLLRAVIRYLPPAFKARDLQEMDGVRPKRDKIKIYLCRHYSKFRVISIQLWAETMNGICKQVSDNQVCIYVYSLTVLFEQHEMLHIVYGLLQLFLIERAQQGHRAFTTFSKPAPRHGPGHIPLKHCSLVVLVGLVISGYGHNQISRIPWWNLCWVIRSVLE